jgi:hypothetical protein
MYPTSHRPLPWQQWFPFLSSLSSLFPVSHTLTVFSALRSEEINRGTEAHIFAERFSHCYNMIYQLATKEKKS